MYAAASNCAKIPAGTGLPAFTALTSNTRPECSSSIRALAPAGSSNSWAPESWPDGRARPETMRSWSVTFPWPGMSTLPFERGRMTSDAAHAVRDRRWARASCRASRSGRRSRTSSWRRRAPRRRSTMRGGVRWSTWSVVRVPHGHDLHRRDVRRPRPRRGSRPGRSSDEGVRVGAGRRVRVDVDHARVRRGRAAAAKGLAAAANGFAAAAAANGLAAGAEAANGLARPRRARRRTGSRRRARKRTPRARAAGLRRGRLAGAGCERGAEAGAATTGGADVTTSSARWTRASSR